jgi:hypothetical protein
LQPLPDKTCQAFVQNVSPDHDLLVEVRRKRPGKPDGILMRAVGPLKFTGGHAPPAHGLLIRTVNVANKGVKAYTGVHPSDQGERLSEAFNFSRILAVPPGEVDQIGGRPSVLIDHGIFHAAEVVPMRATLIKNDGSVTTQVNKVATILGANIYLTAPNQKVNLRWRQQGQDVSLDLKVRDDTTYEIYINNEPLYEDDLSTTPLHDEFHEYFQILNVPFEEQFRLEFPEPIPDRGSSRTPCASVLLND